MKNAIFEIIEPRYDNNIVQLPDLSKLPDINKDTSLRVFLDIGNDYGFDDQDYDDHDHNDQDCDGQDDRACADSVPEYADSKEAFGQTIKHRTPQAHDNNKANPNIATFKRFCYL